MDAQHFEKWDNLGFDPTTGEAFKEFPPPPIDESDGPWARRMAAAARKQIVSVATGFKFYRVYQGNPDATNLEMRTRVVENPFNFLTMQSCLDLAGLLDGMVVNVVHGNPDTNFPYTLEDGTAAAPLYLVFRSASGNLVEMNAGELATRFINNWSYNEVTRKPVKNIDSWKRYVKEDVDASGRPVVQLTDAEVAKLEAVRRVNEG